MGYGNKYPGGMSCAWVIITNYTQVVNVTFSRFSLERSYDGECKNDYLQVLMFPEKISKKKLLD